MPKGYPNPKPDDTFGTFDPVPGEMSIEPPATLEAIKANAPRLVPMKLLKNYVPMSEFEIVGYTKPAVTKKNAAGVVVVEAPEEFITGERMPPALAGTGFANKLWAGTVVRLPPDEAKKLYNRGLATRDFED